MPANNSANILIETMKVSVFKYKAFISYRHSTNAIQHAESLEKALKQYVWPKWKIPLRIYRDIHFNTPDNSLNRLLKTALENSEYLIILAENEFTQSGRCLEELEYWCGTLQRSEKIIIVLIKDEIQRHIDDSINWESTTALPRLLEDYIKSEPYYIDLKWAKTKSEQNLENPDYKGKIRPVLAKLKGITPEELDNEELLVYRRTIYRSNWTITILTVLT